MNPECIYFAHQRIGGSPMRFFLRGQVSEVQAGGNFKRTAVLGPVILLIFFVMASMPARAQSIGGGQIQGAVMDTNGAVVPGASVTATQKDSGLTRVVVSGSDGGYILPNLPVGPYTLDVVKSGFNPYRQ